jgi:AraC-like DNA-binding protein
MELPSILLGAVEGAPQVASRTDAYLRTHPAEAVAVYMMRRGSGFFYHPEGFDQVGPGDIVVVDADRPYIHGFATDAAEYVFHLPRPVLEEAQFLRPAGGAMVARPEGDAKKLVHRAVARQAAALFSGRMASSPDAEVSLLELLRGVLGQVLPQPALRLDAALEYIESHAADPSLGAEAVAAAVYLSRRQLSRVFAEAGLSVSACIRQARLEAAQALLEADGTSLTVAEVAVRCGFSSPSNFARTYREAYGMSPKESRAQCAAA